MTALRREAMDLIENIPDTELMSFINYMLDYRSKNIDSEEFRNIKNKIRTNIIRSGVLCKRTGLNVEEYMKELRENDRI
ncbi:MAG: hypothetical protein J6I62_07840 [Selenomonadaceae bacterium]|nr:hypothetical protein [Selenomonadaceae bacterium]